MHLCLQPRLAHQAGIKNQFGVIQPRAHPQQRACRARQARGELFFQVGNNCMHASTVHSPLSLSLCHSLSHSLGYSLLPPCLSPHSPGSLLRLSLPGRARKVQGAWKPAPVVQAGEPACNELRACNHAIPASCPTRVAALQQPAGWSRRAHQQQPRALAYGSPLWVWDGPPQQVAIHVQAGQLGQRRFVTPRRGEQARDLVGAATKRRKTGKRSHEWARHGTGTPASRSTGQAAQATARQGQAQAGKAPRPQTQGLQA